MSRLKLKTGGTPRHKAFAGADGAIMAAATLAAAGMQTAATLKSAKQQAEAVKSNARSQASAIRSQNENNNALQEKSIEFSRSQNDMNRQQQQNIQMTLQMLAGQQNMNDIMEQNKVQVRNGGVIKRKRLKTQINDPRGFVVTDGGKMVPIAVYPDGGILYEAIGDDHEHYHKTKEGNYESGVGLLFNDGSRLELEGNQKKNRIGEFLYKNDYFGDILAISTHDIKGFNPVKAVINGTHPVQAAKIQEHIKDVYNISDDGRNMARNGKRKSLKLLYGGSQILNDSANLSQLPSNGTVGVATGVAYDTQNPNRFKLKNGGCRKKAKLGNYAGATYASIGNLGGAIISAIGNNLGSANIANAYMKQGNMLANAFSNMKTIDPNIISREDYAAPHAMAVTRGANTNINPQLERLRRNAASETRAINRGTMSSAARLQRLASTNDRLMQRSSEQYAYKHNEDEKIKQANAAAAITAVANENANRDAQANRDYTAAKLNLATYNNDIVNTRITGAAQARANSSMQASGAKANAMVSSFNSIGNALNATGNAFATAYNTNRTNQSNYDTLYAGLNNEQQLNEAVRLAENGDFSKLDALITSNAGGKGDFYNRLNAIKKKYPTRYKEV